MTMRQAVSIYLVQLLQGNNSISPLHGKKVGHHRTTHLAKMGILTGLSCAHHKAM